MAVLDFRFMFDFIHFSLIGQSRRIDSFNSRWRLQKIAKYKGLMIDLGSSIISSTISTVLLYPAERIKIEMQLSQGNEQEESQVEHQEQQMLLKRDKNELKQQRAQLAFKHQTQSIRKNCQRILRKKGWKGFYSGLESLVIGNGLSYGVYFVAYQRLKTMKGTQALSVLDTIQCSAIAGALASFATNPFWVLQTKQTQNSGSLLFKGVEMIQTEGFTSLWKGFGSSLILVSNPIIQFAIYEKLKKMITIQKEDPLFDLIIFLIGALSKIVSTLITYPLTVIRTRQHIDKTKKSKTQIMKQIVSEEGLKGLFKGIEPKIVQTVLNSALLLMLFEKIKGILLRYCSQSQ